MRICLFVFVLLSQQLATHFIIKGVFGTKSFSSSATLEVGTTARRSCPKLHVQQSTQRILELHWALTVARS